MPAMLENTLKPISQMPDDDGDNSEPLTGWEKVGLVMILEIAFWCAVAVGSIFFTVSR